MQKNLKESVAKVVRGNRDRTSRNFAHATHQALDDAKFSERFPRELVVEYFSHLVLLVRDMQWNAFSRELMSMHTYLWRAQAHKRHAT